MLVNQGSATSPLFLMPALQRRLLAEASWTGLGKLGVAFLDDMPYVRMNVAAAPAMLLPQVLELPSKVDKVVDFAWEPKGTRFGVLHGEGPRPTFSLYEMNDMKSTARGVQLVNSQPNKQANCLHWSPQVRPAQLIAAYVLTHSGHREKLCSLDCVE